MIQSIRIPAAELLDGLPDPWPEDLQSRIEAAVRRSQRKVFVLDDDPTGTQTVHGIPVLTHWSAAALAAELQNDLPACYILTNSRSLHLEAAQRINAEIGNRLQAAARETGREIAVISRSDSTLRGHFPGEVAALAAALGAPVDGWILCPFFEEGGRLTVDDVHYVREAQMLIPAGKTEFASDTAFGYRASNLRRWVEEKSAGRIRAADIRSISIEDIRRGGPARIEAILTELTGAAVCVVNAAGYRDLEVLVQGLLAAEAAGKSFVCRTAASFVRVRAGLRPRPLLTAADLTPASSGGGLTIVGSHVPQTTAQLQRLLSERADTTALEVDVGRLLEEPARPPVIETIADRAEAALAQGRDVIIFTSRTYLARPSAAAGLAAGRTISRGLVSILNRIRTRPRYILAKGGVTASDIATKGLQVRRAVVAGQIQPGVPVWEPGPESRFPNCPYVVFPGNVGDDRALLAAIEALDRD